MFARLAIVGVVVATCTVPCAAMVMEQTESHSYTQAVARDDAMLPADPLMLPGFSMTIPDMAPHPGTVGRIFTVPNIAVVLTGLAWVALVRRRLSAVSGR